MSRLTFFSFAVASAVALTTVSAQADVAPSFPGCAVDRNLVGGGAEPWLIVGLIPLLVGLRQRQRSK